MAMFKLTNYKGYELQWAKIVGNKLVVGLNSDESVRRLNGESRPKLPLHIEQTGEAHSPHVDKVITFEGDAPIDLIKMLRPDIIVKGGDYTIDQVVEREVLKCQK